MDKILIMCFLQNKVNESCSSYEPSQRKCTFCMTCILPLQRGAGGKMKTGGMDEVHRNLTLINRAEVDSEQQEAFK